MPYRQAALPPSYDFPHTAPHTLRKLYGQGQQKAKIERQMSKTKEKFCHSAFFIYLCTQFYSPNGGMVDTRDLKSLDQQRLCGFESRFRYNRAIY